MFKIVKINAYLWTNEMITDNPFKDPSLMFSLSNHKLLNSHSLNHTIRLLNKVETGHGSLSQHCHIRFDYYFIVTM
jgi:hypothetical protein